jgi:hypothetical protein
MKLTTKIAVPAIALAMFAGLGLAQERGDERPERQRPLAPPGGDRPARPVPPLLRALDADHDGEISAEEIANASAALSTLDANGDGVLTRDEIAPTQPPRRPGPPSRDGAEAPQGPRPGAPHHPRPNGPRPDRPQG